MLANGGNAQSDAFSTSWPAGGGGRISLSFSSNALPLGSVVAQGGVLLNPNAAFYMRCLNGGAGTIVLHQYTGDPLAPMYRELIVRMICACR